MKDVHFSLRSSGGGVGHTPSLSRPIPGVAEMLESVESQGWKLDQFTSVPYKDNMTVVGLFRRAPIQER